MPRLVGHPSDADGSIVTTTEKPNGRTFYNKEGKRRGKKTVLSFFLRPPTEDFVSDSIQRYMFSLPRLALLSFLTLTNIYWCLFFGDNSGGASTGIIAVYFPGPLSCRVSLSVCAVY